MIASLVESGTDLKTFTKDYLQFMRDLLIARICGDSNDIMDLSEEEVQAIKELANKTNEEHLALLLSDLIKSEPAIRSSIFPRIALELSLLRMSMMSHFCAVDDAIRMLGPSVTARIAAVSHKEVLPKEVITREPKPSLIDNIIKKEPTAAPMVETVKPLVPAEIAPPVQPIVVEAINRQVQAEIAKPAAPAADLPLEKAWEKVTQRLENENTPLASKLMQGSVEIADTGITIVFNNGMSVLAESVKENIPLIQSHIKALHGKQVKVSVETKEVKTISQADLKEKALSNPVVKEALDLFEGRIADLYPINDKDGGAHV
jgi:DNA polymerase-3 subunit gamma/tau